MKIQSLSPINFNQTVKRNVNNNTSIPLTQKQDVIELSSTKNISFSGNFLEKIKLKREAKALKKESNEVQKASQITLTRIKEHQHKASAITQHSKRILKDAQMLKEDIKEMVFALNTAYMAEGVIENVGEVEQRIVQEGIERIYEETQDGKLVRKTIIDPEYITVITTAPYRNPFCHIFDAKTFDLISYYDNFEKFENGGFGADERYVFEDEKLKSYHFDYKFNYDKRNGQPKEFSRKLYGFNNDVLCEYAKFVKSSANGTLGARERILIEPKAILQTIGEFNYRDGSYSAIESYLFEKFSTTSSKPKLMQHEKGVKISKSGTETFDYMFSYQNENLQKVRTKVCQTGLKVDFEKQFEYAGKKQKPVGCLIYEPLGDFYNTTVERYVKF